jgi:4,5:9,10-diseco-3-hydroxy-5,9,17-trioxoandrosta-1(10),2-diene-4-oate hydrolase
MTKRSIPEGSYVDLDNGLTLHYHDEGSGIPLLFVHGSGPGASGWSNFKGNTPFFNDNGYRTLVPDLPGYGYSSKPEDAEYTLEFMVSALEQFLVKLKIDKVVLVGNSMGGAVCIRLALNNSALVHKLILMAPGGLETREVYMEMEGIQTMMRSFFSKKGITKEGMQKTFKLQLFNESLITEAIINERYEIAITQPKTVISTMRIPNQTEDLHKLSCPILGFWGMNDKFCPATGAMTLAKNCSNIQMIMLSECGHWVMVEHADTFHRQSLTFLNKD